MMDMKSEIEYELVNHIIPFWKSLKDTENGGYYGELDFDLKLHKEAVKGCILNSRILWFFSTASMILKDSELLEYATHAYQFMMDYCIDWEYGGVYWSIYADGSIEDSTKHTYNQAFAIYALSAYYKASNNQVALETAMQLFRGIEDNCRDDEGYGEAYSRQWLPVKNEKLSENGVMAERTMNTLLHVFEGYSGLYEATKDKKVEEKLRFIIHVFENKIYRKKKKRQEVFFDREYHSLLVLHSYGHDIETSWLLDWGCGLLKDNQLSHRISRINDSLVEEVYEKAFINGYVFNECERGIDDKTCVWWVQAEAVVGFINAWEKHKDKNWYKEAAEQVWLYIKEHVIDPREGSEWFYDLTEFGQPESRKYIVEPWKCPYHNGRMCFEVMRRLR